MNHIKFQENSAILNDEAKRMLYKTAEFMSFYSNFQYNIIAHTDKSNQKERNALLSKNREAVVKSFLINQYGVDSSQLVINKSSKRSITSNRFKTKNTLNRSVFFTIDE